MMPRWVFMWSMALALFALCKWVTYRRVRFRIGKHDRPLPVVYLLAASQPGWLVAV